MRPLLVLGLLLAMPALAQTPLTGPAAPQKAPSGVFTPAPVPSVAPGVPATPGASVVPEQVAPPDLQAGPANSTPLSGAPTGEGGNHAQGGSGQGAVTPPLLR